MMNDRRRSPSPKREGNVPPSPPGNGRRSPTRRRRSRSYDSPPRRPRRSRSWSRSRSRSPRGRPYPPRDYRDRGGPSDPHYDRFGPGGRPGGYGGGPEGDRDFRGGRDLGPRDGYRDGFGPPDHYDGNWPHHAHAGGGPPFDWPPRGGRGERRRREEGPPGVSLLVRNLPSDIQSLDLQNAFGRIGVIRDVYIPRDFHSQQPKGFAFIEYATPEMAREARSEMDKFVIKGSQLEVVFAQERRKTPNEMRGRMVDGHGRRSPERGERSRGGPERSSSFERQRQRNRERSEPDRPIRREGSPGPKGDHEASG